MLIAGIVVVALAVLLVAGRSFLFSRYWVGFATPPSRPAGSRGSAGCSSSPSWSASSGCSARAPLVVDQDQFYVGEDDGTVVIYRGLDASLPGIELSHPYETTNVTLDRLCEFDAGEVRDGISASSLADARETVDNLAAKMTAAGAGC